MPETDSECEICHRVWRITQLRYNRCKLTGNYEYQCTECRQRIKSGELEH